MARRRLCVALVCPPWLARGVDDLRRALGDTRTEVIGPHVTLVPPVNVDAAAVADAWEVVRAAATAARPFELVLGPAATFAPATPTVHLAVDAGAQDLAQLVALRDALCSGPLSRPDHRPYVPHVTLRRAAPQEQIDGALVSLTGRFGPWHADRVHLLEHVAPDDRVGRGARWFTLAEEPFGGPGVSGRGGLELHVRAVRAVEPSAAALLGRADLSGGVVGADPGRRLVVVAEPPGAPGRPVAAAVGSVDGTTARLGGVVVEPTARREGIGRRTLLAWSSSAATRGAQVVLVDRSNGDHGPEWLALLEDCGFATVGDLSVRRP
ncbi:MAG: 2'-5' RNA ligase family protein [Actinomycetes bacterium]